jgi:hypothetical protein
MAGHAEFVFCEQSIERTNSPGTTPTRRSFYEKAIPVKPTWRLWPSSKKCDVCAPLRVLLYAMSWGQLPANPVHDEVRPDVGAAISCSVSLGKGAIFLFAVAKETGCFGRSSLLLVGRLSLTLFDRL